MSTRQVGKYEIVEEIGRGGFGTVYRARDTMLDREVALKVLHPQLLVDPGFVTRFQQEARVAARLKHPHIVTIHDLGHAEGRWYIAMELLQGRSLDQIIAEDGLLSMERAQAFLRDICAALDYAHDQGLVHRDVKPSNIVVDGETKGQARAVLTDFGLVRAVKTSEELTAMRLVGTIAYMSPEQCAGERVDSRSDIYALGVVLYEMLTGQSPFTADSYLAMLRAIAENSVPAPSSLRPDLAPSLDKILLQTLSKSPAERYAKAIDLADAVNSALERRCEEMQFNSLLSEGNSCLEAGEWANGTKIVGRLQSVRPEDPAIDSLVQRLNEGLVQQGQAIGENKAKAERQRLRAQITELKNELRKAQDQLAENGIIQEKMVTQHDQTGAQLQDLRKSLDKARKDLKTQQKKDADAKSNLIGYLVFALLGLIVVAPLSWWSGRHLSVIRVPATQAEVATNRAVKEGDQVITWAISGSWTVDAASYPYVDRNGYSIEIDSTIVQVCKQVTDWPYGKLLARVGSDFYGTEAFQAYSEGALYLTANDDCPQDNAGSLLVVMIIL